MPARAWSGSLLLICSSAVTFARYSTRYFVMESSLHAPDSSLTELDRRRIPASRAGRTALVSRPPHHTRRRDRWRLVPADSRVLVIYASANRDERQWDRPDEFDVTRRDAVAQLGFGYGEHGCAGQGLARMETQSRLEALARSVTRFSLGTRVAPRPPRLEGARPRSRARRRPRRRHHRRL